jgi:acyl-coenzyme A thioesterase PaaI-like protein
VHSADDLSFDATTRSELVTGGGDGVVVFATRVHELWTVGDKPNGGYLLALLGRVAREVANDEGAHDWEVVASTITYLRPPDLGPADVRVTVLRRGGTAAHVRTVLCQADAELVDAVFVVSGLPEAGSAPRYDDIPPLHIAEPDGCVRLPPHMPGGTHVGMLEAIDLRLDPATLPFTEGPADGGPPVAELRGWTRFVDGREPDPLSLLFFIDAIPPATMMIGSTGWVPTLQMSVYVRARPAPGWLGIRFTAHLVAAGMADETCTVWDSDGAVVAQGTQLARLRFPDDAH